MRQRQPEVSAPYVLKTQQGCKLAAVGKGGPSCSAAWQCDWNGGEAWRGIWRETQLRLLGAGWADLLLAKHSLSVSLKLDPGWVSQGGKKRSTKERRIHGKRPVSEALRRFSRAALKEWAEPRGWLLRPVVQVFGEEYLFCCCCSSFAQSCPTLCAPLDCSQASLSFIISRSLFKLTSIESVMPSNHLILCHLKH